MLLNEIHWLNINNISNNNGDVIKLTDWLKARFLLNKSRKLVTPVVLVITNPVPPTPEALPPLKFSQLINILLISVSAEEVVKLIGLLNKVQLANIPASVVTPVMVLNDTVLLKLMHPLNIFDKSVNEGPVVKFTDWLKFVLPANNEARLVIPEIFEITNPVPATPDTYPPLKIVHPAIMLLIFVNEADVVKLIALLKLVQLANIPDMFVTPVNCVKALAENTVPLNKVHPLNMSLVLVSEASVANVKL